VQNHSQELLQMLGLLLSDTTYASLLNRFSKSFSQSTLRSLNGKILFPLRRWYLTRILAPYLQDSKNVLDLGSSDGRLVAQIQKELATQEKSIQFTGCDIHVQPKTHIPIVQYDGYRLPFADRTFDCVLIVDVLHHTDNPLQVLQEAKRVSSRYILIKDHYWNSSKDFSRLKFADYIGNKPYGIHLSYGFFTQGDWINLVQNTCNLPIVTYKTFRFNFLDPCKHILLKVEV